MKKIWAPDPQHGFVLGSLVDIGTESATVELPNGKVKNIEFILLISFLNFLHLCRRLWLHMTRYFQQKKTTRKMLTTIVSCLLSLNYHLSFKTSLWTLRPSFLATFLLINSAGLISSLKQLSRPALFIQFFRLKVSRITIEISFSRSRWNRLSRNGKNVHFVLKTNSWPTWVIVKSTA